MIRRLRNRRTTIPEESTEATASAVESASAEETASSEAATEETETTEATDPSKAATEQASTEEPDETATETPESEATEESEAATPAVERGPSRLGFAWAACVAVALLLFAGGVGAGGYFALRAHQQSQASARNSAAALEAAKICVAATQAPDTNAMAASEQKIIDCGTDVYRSQALLYTSMLVQAYQAANVHVQVSDERAAVERVNCDGSIDVLVALRVKVSNDQAKDQESGYRLRVTMAPADGQYKIAKLDQVTKPDQVTKKC